jgi:Glucose dehydrogenase C-terminus
MTTPRGTLAAAPEPGSERLTIGSGACPGSGVISDPENEPTPGISQPDQVMLGMPDIGICGTRLMRDMVLKNQVLLGTVNARADAFASALQNLDTFRPRWPAVAATPIAGRYPPEQAPDLILGRPTGIKTVIAFDAP